MNTCYRTKACTQGRDVLPFTLHKDDISRLAVSFLKKLALD